MKKIDHARRQILATSKALINLLGVVYAHTKTSNDGDMYFTRHGLPYSDVLEIENWYEKEWFETHRTRQSGYLRSLIDEGHYSVVDYELLLRTAAHEGEVYKPFDLERAAGGGILSRRETVKLLDVTRSRLKNVGYDGTLLELNDILIAIDPSGAIVMDPERLPEARICNFELIHKV